MENYFLNTPYYKIWCDVISLLAEKTSFISRKTNYSFDKLTCTRDGLIKYYSFGNIQLEIIFSHENRVLSCLLYFIDTKKSINWSSMPPEPIKFNNLEELEVEIDRCMFFLKNELK